MAIGIWSTLQSTGRRGWPRTSPRVRSSISRRPHILGLPDRHGKYEAAPVVVDWDGHQLDDLLNSSENGSVDWHRNIGPTAVPKFSSAIGLVPCGPTDWVAADARKASDWVQSTKPCAADYNGDEKIDLLRGDIRGPFEAKPKQRAEERQRELLVLRERPLPIN